MNKATKTNCRLVNTIVKFTGLGIISFNDYKKRGEIAALRAPDYQDHQLTIRICRPSFNNSQGCINYNRVATYGASGKEMPLRLRDAKIEVKATKNPTIEGYEIYHAEENFDRVSLSNNHLIYELAGREKNDFRWVVDMDDMHGETLFRREAEKECALTNICINNGLFYSMGINTLFYFNKIEVNNGELADDFEQFGYAAETIVAEIEAEQVIFKLTDGQREETHTFEQGLLPTIIEIENNSNFAGGTLSDMPEYYKCLASKSGRKFELKPNVLEKAELRRFIFEKQEQALSFSYNNSNSALLQNITSQGFPNLPNLPNLSDLPDFRNILYMSTGFCHPVKGGGGS